MAPQKTHNGVSVIIESLDHSFNNEENKKNILSKIAMINLRCCFAYGVLPRMLLQFAS